MRKLLFFALIISICTACSKSNNPAPFTDFVVTAENLAHLRAGNNLPLFDFVLPDTLVLTPIEGSQQGWDYAMVKVDTTSVLVFDTVQANSTFPSASFSYSTVDTFGVDTTQTTATAKVYVENSATGLAILGKHINSAVITIPAAQATISYPAQDVATSQKIYEAKFPMKLGDAWSGTNITSTYNFTVNAPIFNLNNAAGTEVHTVNYNSRVTASGYMNLYKRDTGSFSVLVVKKEMTEKVNYFLNGSPAPTSVLMAAGLKDNVTTTYLTYSFYSPIIGYVGTLYIDIPTNTVSRATFRRYF